MLLGTPTLVYLQHILSAVELEAFSRGTAGAPLGGRAWAAPSAARAPRHRRPSRSRRCRSRRNSVSCGRCSNLLRFVERVFVCWLGTTSSSWLVNRLVYLCNMYVS